MKLLSTGEVLEMSGLDMGALNHWCREGCVEPIGGNGSGNHRRYTVPQAVGIAVAAELRRQDRGCALSYVAEVVKAFESLNEVELVRQFVKRRTHFRTIHQGKPILEPSHYPDDVDVKRIYEALT